MTDADLDQAYTALCTALAKVGEAQAPLFLSMVCLSLMSRFDEAGEVLPLIANARAQYEGGLDAKPQRAFGQSALSDP